MSVSYEAARRVALGLEKQQREVITEDPWSVSMGDGFSFAVAEMPFQSFEHPFEPLPEQIAQKSALMLYDDEFEADRTEAEGRLSRLEQALEAGDFPALSALLAEAPVEEWMSLIWFDGVKLREELPPLLEKAAPECRACLGDALEKGISRMVDFTALLKDLREQCKA